MNKMRAEFINKMLELNGLLNDEQNVEDVSFTVCKFVNVGYNVAFDVV